MGEQRRARAGPRSGAARARWRDSCLSLALAALALLPAGCARGPARPRLVLLYAPCTVNKNLLSPYAPSVRFTPSLSAFQAGALTFERHQTESAQSGLAYAALFTGTQAMRHGVYCHPAQLTDGIDSVTRAFARGGWSVHAWLVHPMANASLGYAQGMVAGFRAPAQPGSLPGPSRREQEERLRALGYIK